VHIRLIAAGIVYRAIWRVSSTLAMDGVIFEIWTDTMAISDSSITATRIVCYSMNNMHINDLLRTAFA